MTALVTLATVITMGAATVRRQPECLGDRMRWARSAAGISARGLDQKAGLRPVHVASIEAGRRPNIESRTAMKITAVLGVSLDWLLAGVGERPSPEAVKASVAARDADASSS